MSGCQAEGTATGSKSCLGIFSAYGKAQRRLRRDRAALNRMLFTAMSMESDSEIDLVKHIDRWECCVEV